MVDLLKLICSTDFIGKILFYTFYKAYNSLFIFDIYSFISFGQEVIIFFIAEWVDSASGKSPIFLQASGGFSIIKHSVYLRNIFKNL